MTKGQLQDSASASESTKIVPKDDLYQEVLCPKYYEAANKLLGETREVRNEQVQVIQRWLAENPQINAHNDPRTIIFFLRGAKFDVDKAKKKIKW